MAANQTARHSLGRQGQSIVASALGGKQQAHKAPFDVVDFQAGYAYEVKTMSAFAKDLKIHISNRSFDRKVAFTTRYNVTGILIAVVIYAPDRIEVYRSEQLRHSLRIAQMIRVEV